MSLQFSSNRGWPWPGAVGRPQVLPFRGANRRDGIGEENAVLTEEMVTGSEDFAQMLKVVPSLYCRLGHAGTYRFTILLSC